MGFTAHFQEAIKAGVKAIKWLMQMQQQTGIQCVAIA
jgi:hypothetical protein